LSWSKEDIELLKQNTVEVCPNPERTIIQSKRFGLGVYDPSIGELGFPAQKVVVIPALHAFSYTGRPGHIHDFRFRISLNMN